MIMTAEQIKEYIERRKARCKENLQWAKEVSGKDETITWFKAQLEELENILRNIR